MASEPREYYFDGQSIIQEDYDDSKRFDQFFTGTEEKPKKEEKEPQEEEELRQDSQSTNAELLDKALYMDLKQEFLRQKGYIPTSWQSLMDLVNEHFEFVEVNR